MGTLSAVLPLFFFHPAPARQTPKPPAERRDDRARWREAPNIAASKYRKPRRSTAAVCSPKAAPNQKSPRGPATTRGRWRVPSLFPWRRPRREGGKRKKTQKKVPKNRSKNCQSRTGKFLIPIKYRNCIFYSVSYPFQGARAHASGPARHPSPRAGRGRKKERKHGAHPSPPPGTTTLG